MNYKYVFNRFTSVCTVGLFGEQVNDLPPPRPQPHSGKSKTDFLLVGDLLYDGQDNLCICCIFNNNP